VTRVYTRTRACTTQLIVSRGGARSSKSYSIAQLLLQRFFTMPRRQILILRKTLPSLRISTKMLVEGLIDQWGLKDEIVEEKVNMNIWYNGALIHFGSVDDPEKIKSTEWNDIWMEEATEFTYDDFANLKLRLSAPAVGYTQRNQLILSFNPIDENHWIKTKLVDPGREDLTEIHSTYLENPFLPSDYLKLMRDLINQDMNYYRIFALGLWGKLDNLIYSNWETVPEGKDTREQFYGLDFGFNVPSALVHIAVDGWKAYVTQKLYATGLTNTQIIERLNDVIPPDRRDKDVIYADAQEPNRIAEINAAGFRCVAANKMVSTGIDTVKRFQLKMVDNEITPCTDGLKEIRGYSYKTDRDGRTYDEPIKFNDHFMDALRYGLHTRFADRIGKRARVRVTYA